MPEPLPQEPASLMPTPSDVASMINRLFTDATRPEQPSVAVEITREHLSGLFDAKLQVNPDATFDRQLLLNLSQQMMPILQGLYPLGLQRLLKRIWELHSLKGFEQIFPTEIAELATRRLLALAQAEMKQLEAAQQQEQMAGLMQQLAPLFQQQEAAQGQADQNGERAALEAQTVQAEAAARTGLAEANLSRAQLQALSQVFKLLQQYQQVTSSPG